MQGSIELVGLLIMLSAMAWFTMVWPFRKNQGIWRYGYHSFWYGYLIIGSFITVAWAAPFALVSILIQRVMEGVAGWQLVGEAILAVVFCVSWVLFTLNLRERRRWSWGVLLGLLWIFAVMMLIETYEDVGFHQNKYGLLIFVFAATIGQAALFTIYIRKRWHEFIEGFWRPPPKYLSF